MASEDAVIARQFAATARVTAATAALADQNGVEVAEMPPLPREVSPDFRAMIATEVLADTLERLAAATESVEPDETDIAIRRQAIDTLSDAGLNYETADALADTVVLLAGLSDGDIEAVATRLVATLPPVKDPDDQSDDAGPDLSAMTRDELNAHATSLGVDAPESLPNKAAVIDAIDAAEAS